MIATEAVKIAIIFALLVLGIFFILRKRITKWCIKFWDFHFEGEAPIVSLDGLSDVQNRKRAELAATILEKSHLVHRAIKSSLFDYGREEFESAREMFCLKEEELNKPSCDVSQGKMRRDVLSVLSVIKYRMKKNAGLFLEYLGMDIKAKIHFPQDVYDLIGEMKDILKEIEIGIEIVETFLRQQDLLSAQQHLNAVRAYPRSVGFGKFVSPEIVRDVRRNQERFSTILDRLESVLLPCICKE